MDQQADTTAQLPVTESARLRLKLIDSTPIPSKMALSDWVNLLDQLLIAVRAEYSSQLNCHVCGKSATCIGNYEGAEHYEPACDRCCGHGNEDGWCRPIPEAIAEMSKWILEANTAENVPRETT